MYYINTNPYFHVLKQRKERGQHYFYIYTRADFRPSSYHLLFSIKTKKRFSKGIQYSLRVECFLDIGEQFQIDKNLENMTFNSLHFEKVPQGHYI